MESFKTDQTSGILESACNSEKVVKIITRFNELIAPANLKLLGKQARTKRGKWRHAGYLQVQSRSDALWCNLKLLSALSTNPLCFTFKVFMVKRVLNDCMSLNQQCSSESGHNNKLNCEMLNYCNIDVGRMQRAPGCDITVSYTFYTFPQGPIQSVWWGIEQGSFSPGSFCCHKPDSLHWPDHASTHTHTHTLPLLTEPPGSDRYRSLCVMARINAASVCQESVCLNYRVVLRGVRCAGMEEALDVFSLLGN